MTIRTIEDHLKLNTDEKLQYSEYLPVSLAYLLPCLFQTFADVSGMNDEESCRAEMEVVQTILDSNPNLTVKGFKPSHKCRLDYSKNLRTFAEAHQNIDGKPSIGIQFTDADDGYNDWVWIAVDVIQDFRYTTLSFRSDEMERLYKEFNTLVTSETPKDSTNEPKLRSVWSNEIPDEVTDVIRQVFEQQPSLEYAPNLSPLLKDKSEMLAPPQNENPDGNRTTEETQMCEMTDCDVPKRKPSNNLGKILLGVLVFPFVGTYVSFLTLGYLLFVPFVVLISLGMIVPEALYLGVVVLPVAFWRKLVFGEEFSFPEFVSGEMLTEGLKSMWRSYTINVGKIFFR